MTFWSCRHVIGKRDRESAGQSYPIVSVPASPRSEAKLQAETVIFKAVLIT